MQSNKEHVFYVDVLPEEGKRRKRSRSGGSIHDFGASESSDSTGSTMSSTYFGSSESEVYNDDLSERDSGKSQRTGSIDFPKIKSCSSLGSVLPDSMSNGNTTLQSKEEKSVEDSAMKRVISMPQLSAAYQVEETTGPDPFADTNPVEFLKKIVESHGYSSKAVPSLSIKNFFEEITPEHIAGYDTEITEAVRTENLPLLRQLRSQGRMMQCCNRFGESIMHMACRRGYVHIVKFLMEECGSSIRLRDDFGRTPLHDACWTAEVEYDVVALLIQAEPHLILTCDKRGHTPLDYVRRENWGGWCRFLLEHRDALVPREILEKMSV